MIVLGYAWLAETFDQPGDENVILATDSGFLVSGKAEDATASRAEQWRVTHGNMLSLGQDVEKRWSEVAGGTRTALLIMDLPHSSDAPWASLVQEFAVRAADGRGAKGSASNFVQRALWMPADAARESATQTSLTLPSGHEYLVRHIEGVADVEVLQDARSSGLTVCLRGPFGSGKSTVVSAAHGSSLVTLKCHEGMTREDVLGGWSPVANRPGEFEWIDGPLLVAMAEGRPLLIDDVGWMPSGLQALLLPVLDDTRAIDVVDRPNEPHIAVQPGFSACITLNPGVGFGLSGPLHDRIVVMIDVPVALDSAADLAIPPAFASWAKALHRRVIESGDETLWVPSTRSLVQSVAVVELFGIRFAAAALVSKCPEDQRESALVELQNFTDVSGPLRSESK